MIILIVEDDAIDGLCMAGELMLSGYHVVGPVSSNEEALTLAKSCRPALALVNVDLQYNGEGIEVAKNLKQEGVETLFLTAEVSVARQYPDRAVGVLAKPFHPEDVPEAVDVIAEVLVGNRPPPWERSIPLELFPFSPPRQGSLT